MNWNLSNRLTIILVIGGLANLGCLAYLLLGVTERSDLHSNIETHASTITSLQNQLPPASRHAVLSNQIALMSRRVDQHKQNMAYEFGDLIPDKFDESPQVVVSDRRSKAADELTRTFESANQPAPSDAPGLPDEPPEDANREQYLKQLRQIHVAKRIVNVLLEQNVREVTRMSSTDPASEHPVLQQLKTLDDMSVLTGPIQVTFKATLKTTLSVLTTFQTAPTYLQVFDLKISSGSSSGERSMSGDEPVLNVNVTVAPVYEKPEPPSEDTDGEGDETETDSTDENSSDDGIFGN